MGGPGLRIRPKKAAAGRAGFLLNISCCNVGLGSSGYRAERRTLSRTSGGRPDCPAAAWTASIAVEWRIFHPGPLVFMERVRTSRPAHWTYPVCLERVRAGAAASMEHKMGTTKAAQNSSQNDAFAL